MFGLNLLYVLTIVFYSLSVLGYFIDFIQNNQKVNRAAFWLLSSVWVLQLLFILMRMIKYDRFPIMTIFEGMFFYAFILVTIALIINRLYKMDFLVFVVNLVGFSILTISLFAPAGDISSRLSELFILELLIIHVVVLLLSYGMFTLSFAFSMLYFLQHQMLKRKLWGKRMSRTGNLSNLERRSFIFNLVGFPLMLIGLILGVIWAWVTVETIPWNDVKVLSSFIVLFVYGVYLFQYQVKKRRGYELALLNIAAFLVLLINYFLSSSFSEFHIW
ncbi:cytochrome C assembly protein [Salipaludibacillus neizhouensis]|uniref:Cytochrome C assembly protein n=1 Tax=Salipaludibacillus neizhouensis TaxID=885475 RepID=A0A3A9JYJ1_9BACI|nr:cytochrome c biogenesis protein CcsA [Salipaludibacillus neizhouensis]RKL65954.1 cytochrome C assembly protein [Salipaludibacillus neizhouensis]